jgi:hypothetical protein
MRSPIGSAQRYVAVLAVCLAGFAMPGLALEPAGPQPPQSAPQVVVPASEWQSVITGQIEAFRHHDATSAFSYAGAVFRVSFPDAATFYEVILASGYEPLMKSRTHTFGEFVRIDNKTVAQLVHIVGSDNLLYEALFRMGEEPDGWRVEGVALAKKPGVAI